MENNNENRQAGRGADVPATAQQLQPQPEFSFFNEGQFNTMQRVARMFCNSELVPEMYKTSKTNPEQKAMANCMLAIDTATRIGASPLMVMQNMIIIYGRPSWSAKFLIATVNTCGRFNPLKFRFTSKGEIGDVRYTTYTKTPYTGKDGRTYFRNEAAEDTFDGKGIEDIECVAYTTARGSDEVLESSPVSLSLAVREGWFTKNGSKWQTMPRQMLIYRAATFWTNAYAPELSMGMRTMEEMQDISGVFEPVIEQAVARAEEEKSANANSETVKVDLSDGGEGEPKEEVDTDTGEVLFKDDGQGAVSAAPQPGY